MQRSALSPLPPTQDRGTAGAPYRRFAVRSGAAALLAMTAVAWTGRDLLPALATPRAALLVGVFSAALGCLVAGAYVAVAMTRRVSQPTATLAAVVEAAAGGDLSAAVPAVPNAGEVGRLSHAVRGIVGEMRRLATALRTAAHETAAMAAEITAGTEAMATGARETALASGQLSARASEMGATLRELSGAASRVAAIASGLRAEADETLARSGRVRTVAGEGRARLEASAGALEALQADARASAAAVEALTAATGDIAAFVAQVRKMARQSKLLALNAAMEAARAGEHGQGFAVVANEVRRLATTSAEAAERTALLVKQVLGRVEESRRSSARAVEAAGGVIDATRAGREAFAEVEDAVAAAATWGVSVAEAADASSSLVHDLTARIELAARGTESFVGAIQQVATSSEQQRASAGEIGAAAATLAAAAAELAEVVAAFRLGEADEGSGPAAASGEQVVA